jgi:transcriptional regulator with XRE-family HTH domain
MGIGERLKEERERLNLSQTQFADLAGVGRKSQYNYEEEERYPDAPYLAAIAAAGADVLYIITGMRGENTATTPTELAYLRNCRAFPTHEARQDGLNGLVNLRKAYGVTLEDTYPPANDKQYPMAAQEEKKDYQEPKD